MYDFLTVKKEFLAKQQRYVYRPAFVIKSRIKDLMIRGRDFYALWDEAEGLWTTDESKAVGLIDQQVREEVERQCGKELLSDPEHGPIIKTMYDADSGMIDKWHKYCQNQLRDNYISVNQKVKFSNSEVKREDYCTFKLDYPLQEQATPYYDKLVGTLYPDIEREKFEWAVGCVLAGDQQKIQKLFVFYGEPGSGKSTVINKIIVDTIFGGQKAPYCSKFTAGLLASRDQFGTGFLANDPIVAFDDDADLSRIEDNTKLNLIVSHEAIKVNEKFARTFVAYPNCVLFCGTNEAVSLSPNSGLNRRLIDIRQTGDKVSPDEYDDIMDHLQFERSGIAYHCLQVYKKLGKNYYNHYIPEDMLSMTSPFHNFVKDFYLELRNGTTLSNAYKLYVDYAQESNYKTIITRYKFRDQLKLYFTDYGDHTEEDGSITRSFFEGFKKEKIGIKDKASEEKAVETSSWLKFDAVGCLFDAVYEDRPAQYANEKGTPSRAWDRVKTTLKQINTSKLHFVQVPENLIVIDFDIKGDDGEKSYTKNLEAASKFPPTYAELSKSGSGIHLHYIYTGDTSKLSHIYGDNIEVKVFTGNAALRRLVTKCNSIPIADLSSGLPLKEGGTGMVNWQGVENEKHLRSIIYKDLKKEIFPATKPSIDHIHTVLTYAYVKNLRYDVEDLYPAILAFGMNSSHQSSYCVNLINRMRYKGQPNEKEEAAVNWEDNNAPIIFLDCEIFPDGIDSENKQNPGLFLINWKFAGKDKKCVRMINPTPDEVRNLFKYRIIAFNGRKYDNHMLWARSMGYSIHELYNLSQKMIVDHMGFFSEAYNLSYADPLDYASAGNKQGLKKWEIQLGITHIEMALPWDKPVPVSQWTKVAEYCDNDVISLEAVHEYLHSDFEAREILAVMSGLTVNDTTNTHTTKILTGGIKDPQKDYIYTDLSKMKWPDGSLVFPGYEFNEYGIDQSHYKHDAEGNLAVKVVSGKSCYKGIDPGEGGRKIAYPGYYENVWLFDVASMHPHSAIKLKVFGDVITKRFENIVEARVAIKHGDYDTALNLLSEFVDKKLLEPYLTGDPDKLKKSAKALANALKTAINSVYGLTSASFDNKLRDPRNKDNIIAKYGALFMINLHEEIEAKGYTVVHISTDSIKVANCDEQMAAFIMDFGKKYGYTFELEAKYEKMCIVNDAVYIAKEMEEDGTPLKNSERFWTATGKQFQVPYVFKSLFSHEEIIFDDMCETNSVQKGAMYLKRDGEGDVPVYEFIGRVGRFTPILPDRGGAELLRSTEGAKNPYAAVSGSKGYFWLESETVKQLHKEGDIDRSYYQKLCDDAVDSISKYVDFDKFVNEQLFPIEG